MIKKPLSLKDAMRSLHIVETDEGIELQSAAGTAKYDAWGVRHEVNGIPEYFPTTISLRARAPAPKEKSYSSGISMAIDAGDANKAIELIDEQIRNSEAFINDAAFTNGAIHAAAIETPQPVTNIYNISFGVRRDDPVQNKVTISTDGIGIHTNIEEVLRNAMAANEEVERLRDVMKNAASEGVQQALAAVERDFRSNGKLRRLLGI
ncbi:hypothetical protein ACMAUW_001711 [Citrobacter farmeri]